MGQDLSCDTTQIRPFGRSRLRSALYINAKRSCCNVQTRRPYSGKCQPAALTPNQLTAVSVCPRRSIRECIRTVLAPLHGSLERIGRPYFSCSTVYVLLCTSLFYHTFPTLSRGNFSFFIQTDEMRNLSRKSLTKLWKYVTIR